MKYTPDIYTIAEVFPAVNTIAGVRRESYSLISPFGNIAMAGRVVSMFYSNDLIKVQPNETAPIVPTLQDANVFKKTIQQNQIIRDL